MSEATPLPFKPGDWVAQKDTRGRVAKVRNVYRDGSTVLLDLCLYTLDGRKVGRESEPMDGPKSFEPACEASGWERISKPVFPVTVRWVTYGSGRKVARYWAGDILPPANWLPAARKMGAGARRRDVLRDALEAIADGHNDPVNLAREVLGMK